MTSTEVRTYTVGERVEDGDYAKSGDYGRWCRESIPDGWVCSIEAGHAGPQHVAVGGDVVRAVKDREQGPTFEPGDVVMRLESPRIAVGTVLSVTREADRPVAWLAGKEPGETEFRLMSTDARTLRPYAPGTVVGDSEPPTLAQIGEAFVRKHKILDEALTTTREARDTVTESLRNAERMHDEFRDRVRALAIEKAADLGWCTPGLNAALEELGLPPKDGRYRVRVQVTATRYIDVAVRAPDGSEAWSAVDAMSESELAEAYEDYTGDSFQRVVLDNGAWEHVSHDSSTSTEHLGD